MHRPPFCVAFVCALGLSTTVALADPPLASTGETPPLPVPPPPAPALAPSPAPTDASPAAPSAPYGAAPPPTVVMPPGYYGYPPGYAPYGPAPYGPMSQPMPAYTRYSTPLFVSGIVALSLGGVGVIAGSVLWGAGSSQYELYCTDDSGFASPCGEADDPDKRDAGVGLLVAGGVLAAAGIPMLIVGGRRVPKDEAPPSVSAAVGPRGATVRLSF